MCRLIQIKTPLRSTIFALVILAFFEQAVAQVIDGPDASGEITTLVPAHLQMHFAGNVDFSSTGKCKNEDTSIIGAKLTYTVSKFDQNTNEWTLVHTRSSDMALISPGAEATLTAPTDTKPLAVGSYRIVGDVEAWFVDLQGQTISNPTLVKRKTNHFFIMP